MQIQNKHLYLYQQKQTTMKTQQTQYRKKGELRTYKMICSTFGHLFNFVTDDAQRFLNDWASYHSRNPKNYTYAEAELVG